MDQVGEGSQGAPQFESAFIVFLPALLRGKSCMGKKSMRGWRRSIKIFPRGTVFSRLLREETGFLKAVEI